MKPFISFLNFSIIAIFAALVGFEIEFVSAQGASPQQALTNVKTALFVNNNWELNVNYLDANSPDFWHLYLLNAPCDTLIKFQEVYCLGKSINVTITNLQDTTKMYNLSVISNQPFNCSSNIQTANEAALDPRYAKGQITLPTGIYSIAMKLLDEQNVLGFRGYDVKASVSLDRLLLAGQCRKRQNHNPNLY